MNADARTTLRAAATFIRRMDKMMNGELEIEGRPAKEVELDLLELAGDYAMVAAMEHVRGLASRQMDGRVVSLDERRAGR